MNRLPYILREEAVGGDTGGGGTGAATGAAAGSGKPGLVDTKGGAASGSAGSAGTGGKAAVGEVWWQGWQKSDGTLDHGRLDHLPDELKGAKSWLSQFKTHEDFVRSAAHQNKLVGEKGVTRLREGASESEIAAHREALRVMNGTPAKWEEYGNKRPEGVPEQLWNQGYVDGALQILHKYAASPALVQELLAFDKTSGTQNYEAGTQKQAKDWQNYLKTESQKLDEAFGTQRARREAIAVNAAKQLGIDPDSDLFQHNATVVIACAKYAEAVGEGKFVSPQGEGSGAMSPAQEMEDIKGNPQNRFYQVMHDEAVRRQNPDLYERAIQRMRELAKGINERQPR